MEKSNSYTNVTTSYQYQTSEDYTLDFDQISSSSSTDFYEQMITDTNIKPHHLSFQEIMDIVVTPPATVKSAELQTGDTIFELNDDQNKILVIKKIYFHYE